MTVHCRRCGSADVRLSHFQAADILQLLILRYPVRCLDCSERGYFYIADLSELRRRAENHRRDEARRAKAS